MRERRERLPSSNLRVPEFFFVATRSKLFARPSLFKAFNSVLIFLYNQIKFTINKLPNINSL